MHHAMSVSRGHVAAASDGKAVQDASLISSVTLLQSDACHTDQSPLQHLHVCANIWSDTTTGSERCLLIGLEHQDDVGHSQSFRGLWGCRETSWRVW